MIINDFFYYELVTKLSNFLRLIFITNLNARYRKTYCKNT